ncbi:uncharacterized protein MONBRDRAFT_30987 [Monosiga brevicollis MX1]|uniref:Uncharacterized protein n=1 Tax=Monosiga brevicollis TaxID=81824 RepID=A9UQL5_MONBE|nr:uncharacterized protein MONBRDRAFT_30987 [Monosiga brevicollis MX1]EDQ93066.1 predicted protein [Monosiga brevicollis MX1]|eukprot:XP_001742828.1 hypothetical protein [Monosiga brevicollis MX1]
MFKLAPLKSLRQVAVPNDWFSEENLRFLLHAPQPCAWVVKSSASSSGTTGFLISVPTPTLLEYFKTKPQLKSLGEATAWQDLEPPSGDVTNAFARWCALRLINHGIPVRGATVLLQPTSRHNDNDNGNGNDNDNDNDNDNSFGCTERELMHFGVEAAVLPETDNSVRGTSWLVLRFTPVEPDCMLVPHRLSPHQMQYPRSMLELAQLYSRAMRPPSPDASPITPAEGITPRDVSASTFLHRLPRKAELVAFSASTTDGDGDGTLTATSDLVKKLRRHPRVDVLQQLHRSAQQGSLEPAYKAPKYLSQKRAKLPNHGGKSSMGPRTSPKPMTKTAALRAKGRLAASPMDFSGHRNSTTNDSHPATPAVPNTLTPGSEPLAHDSTLAKPLSVTSGASDSLTPVPGPQAFVPPQPAPPLTTQASADQGMSSFHQSIRAGTMDSAPPVVDTTEASPYNPHACLDGTGAGIEDGLGGPRAKSADACALNFATSLIQHPALFGPMHDHGRVSADALSDTHSVDPLIPSCYRADPSYIPASHLSRVVHASYIARQASLLPTNAVPTGMAATAASKSTACDNLKPSPVAWRLSRGYALCAKPVSRRARHLAKRSQQQSQLAVQAPRVKVEAVELDRISGVHSHSGMQRLIDPFFLELYPPRPPPTIANVSSRVWRQTQRMAMHGAQKALAPLESVDSAVFEGTSVQPLDDPDVVTKHPIFDHIQVSASALPLLGRMGCHPIAPPCNLRSLVVVDAHMESLATQQLMETLSNAAGQYKQGGHGSWELLDDAILTLSPEASQDPSDAVTELRARVQAEVASWDNVDPDTFHLLIISCVPHLNLGQALQGTAAPVMPQNLHLVPQPFLLKPRYQRGVLRMSELETLCQELYATLGRRSGTSNGAMTTVISNRQFSLASLMNDRTELCAVDGRLKFLPRLRVLHVAIDIRPNEDGCVCVYTDAKATFTEHVKLGAGHRTPEAIAHDVIARCGHVVQLSRLHWHIVAVVTARSQHLAPALRAAFHLEQWQDENHSILSLTCLVQDPHGSLCHPDTRAEAHSRVLPCLPSEQLPAGIGIETGVGDERVLVLARLGVQMRYRLLFCKRAEGNGAQARHSPMDDDESTMLHFVAQQFYNLGALTTAPGSSTASGALVPFHLFEASSI